MENQILRGIAASPGLAMAKAFYIHHEQNLPERSIPEHPEAEARRFKEAVQAARAEIEAIRDRTEVRLGPDKAEIFEGHLMILEDPDYIDAIEQRIIEEQVNAEFALHETAQAFIELLQSLEDELLRERTVDIKDITSRLMNHLLGIQHPDLAELSEECIIIAKDLTPSDTAQLNLDVVRGFITEIGSRTSHAAIMARSLEVPAIVGVGKALYQTPVDEILIMDADEGSISLRPTPMEQASFLERKSQYDQRKTELLRLKNQPSLSADRVQVELAANIGSIEDVQRAIDRGAEGIGLFRTEFLYMGRSNLPSEEEQFTSYRYVLEKMNPKPVVIRTLDIGGDKELPYMELPKESNPFLGQRAIRLCLQEENLFRTQLRALLRASAFGNLKIMFPMIAVTDELLRAKLWLREEHDSLIAEGHALGSYEIGIMIEVPAAAIAADLLAPEVDFFSIGTNDLIQYTMAADRMNESLSYLYQPCHPSLLRLIQMVIRAAKQEGKWVGMCGEMAGDPIAIPLLLGMGLDEFSMSSGSILQAREQIQSLDQSQWANYADQVLMMRSAEEIVQFVQLKLHDVVKS